VNGLLLLIPLSILFLVGAGVALFWAVNHGQFENMETPALLPLIDAVDSSSTSVSQGEPSGQRDDRTGQSA
jgi:cbb3-type cytochrome oxidase maturation protein